MIFAPPYTSLIADLAFFARCFTCFFLHALNVGQYRGTSMHHVQLGHLDMDLRFTFITVLYLLERFSTSTLTHAHTHTHIYTAPRIFRPHFDASILSCYFHHVGDFRDAFVRFTVLISTCAITIKIGTCYKHIQVRNAHGILTCVHATNTRHTDTRNGCSTPRRHSC